MLKKSVSAVVVLCLLCSLAAPLAMAAGSFSDVISPDYDWAMNVIEEMTRLGIIKGYTDGTFRPANTIKKIEMLLLLARAAGYSNKDYSAFAAYALDRYGDVLDDYDLGTSYNKYKPEVAFLLYKGVLNSRELDSLLSNAAEPVKRYEAAVLLTKLMGAEDEVKGNTAVVLDYADYADIPVSARAYVEYVTAQGLMNGVEDNNFAPKDDVTRVQVTVMLDRIINKLKLSTQTGIVESVDAKGNSVTLYNEGSKSSKKYTVNPKSVDIILDGEGASLKDIEEGSAALVLYRSGKIYSLEVLSSDIIIPEEPENNEPENKDGVVEALVDTISASDLYLAAFLYDSNSNISDKFVEYEVSKKVTVTRNSAPAKLENVRIGDNVLLTLKNGVVTNIEAESINSSVTGTIFSILISEAPEISITAEDALDYYPIVSDAVFTVDGKAASIYALRLGQGVELTLEGDYVTEIKTVKITPVTQQLNGYIDEISAEDATVAMEVDGETVLVSLASANIIDSSTGDKIKLSKLEEGQTVTVVGSYNGDVFVAKTVLVVE